MHKLPPSVIFTNRALCSVPITTSVSTNSGGDYLKSTVTISIIIVLLILIGILYYTHNSEDTPASSEFITTIYEKTQES